MQVEDKAKKTAKLPDSPGVYFFLDGRKKPIYIGKATSLRDRVRSYFGADLIHTRGPLLVKMIHEAKSIDFKKTDSVLEALLLEADLIKKFRPKFNTKEKDDKSFLCVAITKEDFPQVLTIRKNELTASNLKLKAIYGPFPNGTQLKEALKIMRRIFPYRDEKCKLNSTRPCFNYTIGLCPGTCIGAVEKKCYAKRIRRIELFLGGKIKDLLKDLERDMKAQAKEKNFEAAKAMRDKIYALQHINDVALIKDDIKRGDAGHFRIESYDIAHLSGKDMVGVMAVSVDGNLDKSSYRKFKIRGFSDANDPGALKEIVERRLKHEDWPLPSFIVVDGGVAQINSAKEAIKNAGKDILVLAVVKDERHKAKGILGDGEIIAKYQKEIVRLNADTHRFAISYHKNLRKKNFFA